MKPKYVKLVVKKRTKFKFDSLSKIIKLEHEKYADILIGKFTQNIDVSGKAVCLLRNDIIFYGKRRGAKYYDSFVIIAILL